MAGVEGDVVARLAALEALSVCTLALLFAMVPNDPTKEKQAALLAALESDFSEGLDHLPPATQTEAKAVLSDLLNRVILREEEYRAPTPGRQQ